MRNLIFVIDMDVLTDESVDNEVRSEFKDSEEYEEEYGEKDQEYGELDEDQGDLGPVEITEVTLKQIERELCLIRLCWPPLDLENFYLAQLPNSYRTTSDKEKLLLWYAENFRKQYHTIYRDRKPLLMACDNECGVQKFVSMSIRPSTLPYPELYTWQGCANFVSDHLEYEPLVRPLAMPTNLCSPTWLMRLQRGNSFEYATLLVSLLLGQGYNAFVVSGYASREQVHFDMSMRPCPYLPEPVKPPAPPVLTDASRYRLDPPPDFQSQLLRELEAKNKQKIQEEIEDQEREHQKMLFEFERPPPDEYWGNRIHAWVVVLPEPGGAREHEIRAPFFIEPTSGMSYMPDDSETNLLYHGVESVWNDRNYWVNIQTCSEACSKIDWNLTNGKLWIHLLPGEPWTTGDIDEAEDIDEWVRLDQQKHLDMPFSYADEIYIDGLDFERRYPNGRKTRYFKKTIVEFFAPYLQMDGLVRKVTCYKDYEYRFPTHAYEKYLNRVDNLMETTRFFDTGTITDYYKRGRRDACKEHRYSTTGNDRVDEDRALDFYDVVRIDGLSRIEMDPLHLTQHYVGRNDFLYYRHVEFSAENEHSPQDVHYRNISKVIEKYHRNPSLPASKDVAIREFAISEDEIRLKFHYEKFNITRITRIITKPPMAERGDELTFNPDLIRGYNPDPMAFPDKQLELFYEEEKQMKDEAKSLTLIRDAEAEIVVFLKVRRGEYMMPKLTVSLFDRNRNEEARAGMLAKEEQLRAHSQREVEDDVDYLGPYLARLGNPSKLSKHQSLHIRQECLNDLKKLMTDRANRMSQALEACNKELNKIQNWFTQAEGKTREEEEKMLNLTNEINFKMNALDIRLQRHCELASKCYRDMVKILKADKRLAVLEE